MLIPRTFVHYIITKYKTTKCIDNMIGRLRKRRITAHDDHCTPRKIMINRQIPSSATKAELQPEFDIAISESTIRQGNHETGLFGRIAGKKPNINIQRI